MSFEKRYPNAKDNRKRLHRYRGSKRFDTSCRPGGDCPWCFGNRKRQENKAKAKAEDDMKGLA